MANAYTGHIVDDLDRVPASERKDYSLVPENLKEEVQKALDGKSETTVDTTDESTPIGGWMREERDRREAEETGAPGRTDDDDDDDDNGPTTGQGSTGE